MFKLIFLILFFAWVFLKFPNFAIQFFIFISLIIPINFTSNAYKIVVNNIDFSVIDFLFYALILCVIFKELNNKKTILPNKYVIIFLFFNILFFAIGILSNNDISQALYDIRPIFYYFLLMINFKKLGCNLNPSKLIDSFLFGISVYSLSCLTLLYFKGSHPFFIFLSDNDFINLGRISFQQDLLLLIAIPILINLILQKSINFNKKLVYQIFLFLCLFKLVIGMSRGLIFFTFLNTILTLFFFNKRNVGIDFFVKIFKNIFYIAILTLFLNSFQSLFTEKFSFDYFTSRFSDFYNFNNNFRIYQIDNRIIMWVTAFDECIDSLFLGNGFGYTFAINHNEWIGKKISFIDSVYATLVIRSGLLSAIFFLMIYVNLIKRLNFLIKLNYDSSIFLILKYSIILLLFLSIFNSYLILSISNFTFLLIISYTFNYYFIYPKKNI